MYRFIEFIFFDSVYIMCDMQGQDGVHAMDMGPMESLTPII